MVKTQMKIATLAEMGDRKSIVVNTDVGKLALFRVDDELFATQARCPHAKGPLAGAEICGHVISCPWHGWSFNLVTGECDEDPDLLLQTYSVRAVDGDIVLEI